MRYYQIGEYEIFHSENICNFLKNKNSIIEEKGEDYFYSIYKYIANGIREKLSFNYFIALGTFIPKENATEEDIKFSSTHISITIFEYEDDGNLYDIEYDKDKKLWYIEV